MNKQVELQNLLEANNQEWERTMQGLIHCKEVSDYLYINKLRDLCNERNKIAEELKQACGKLP
jgi:hypothetical protein